MKTYLKNIVALSFVASAPLLMSGCAQNIGASNYASAGVGEAMTSYAGVIVSKRQVMTQESDKLQGNTLGLVAGGIGGALIGSTIGQGKGSTLATVGGAAVGALGGAYAQQELSKQAALEYTIQLDNGQLKTVVQGMDVNLAPGSRVILHISHKGRSRIVPFAG